jgi:hypothetical protein
LKESTPSARLRTLTLMILFAAAAASLVFVMCAGRRNSSVVLVTLFALWVLSPYFALFKLHREARRSLGINVSSLNIIILIISIGSVVGYSGVLSPPGSKLTGVFLTVPFVFWICIVIILIGVKIYQKFWD